LAARSNAGVDQPGGRPLLATDRRRASSEINQPPGRGPLAPLHSRSHTLFGSGSPRNAVSRDRAQAEAQRSVRAGDTFRLTPGSGGRVTFPRSNLGAFSLDIGTVETESVNGIGGDDCQDETGRLWDVVYLLACAVRRGGSGRDNAGVARFP